jgi:hypothetical protein
MAKHVPAWEKVYRIHQYAFDNSFERCVQKAIEIDRDIGLTLSSADMHILHRFGDIHCAKSAIEALKNDTINVFYQIERGSYQRETRTRKGCMSTWIFTPLADVIEQIARKECCFAGSLKLDPLQVGWMPIYATACSLDRLLQTTVRLNLFDIAAIANEIVLLGSKLKKDIF